MISHLKSMAKAHTCTALSEEVETYIMVFTKFITIQHSFIYSQKLKTTLKSQFLVHNILIGITPTHLEAIQYRTHCCVIRYPDCVFLRLSKQLAVKYLKQATTTSFLIPTSFTLTSVNRVLNHSLLKCSTIKRPCANKLPWNRRT